MVTHVHGVGQKFVAGCPGCQALAREQHRRRPKRERTDEDRARQKLYDANRKTLWRDKNPRRALDTVLRREYGISHDEYTALILAQDGQCAICHAIPDRLHVDHDHATGRVRQLLCGSCNRMLGMAKDNPHLLARAADYLKEHQS